MPAALLVVPGVAALGFSREQARVLGVVGLVRCFESLSDICYGFAQKHERMDLVVRSLFIRGLSAVAFFGGRFWFTGDLALSLGGMAVAWLLTIVLFDGPHLKRLVARAGEPTLRPRLQWALFRNIVWLALPLGVVMLLKEVRMASERRRATRESLA